MGFLKRYYQYIKKDYYIHIPLGLLILNYIVQRVFGINKKVPFSVHYTSKISGFSYMKISDSSRISFTVSGGAYIVAHPKAQLYIGENVIFSYNVCIQTINHGLLDRKNFIPRSVKIGDNCWLGNNVTILPGVCLGKNVTVGANSVVTKSFPDNVVIAGNPAKIIKKVCAE